MEKKAFSINNTPSLLWGKSSNKLFLYIHGKFGNKEVAETFATIAADYGWQVLSFDLPEHGSRKKEKETFVPWLIVPEILDIMAYAKQRWNVISLFAESIGAWFSLLSLNDELFEQCLFVSPLLDMQQFFNDIMKKDNISENQLKIEQRISTSIGQTLSWDYLSYVRQHSIDKWLTQTKILYGEQDELIARNTVELFCKRFNCELTIAHNAKHWFGAEQQLPVLKKWITGCLS